MPTSAAASSGKIMMHNFATCPLRSNTLILPDKYSDRNPNPAKDPVEHFSIESDHLIREIFKLLISQIFVLSCLHEV